MRVNQWIKQTEGDRSRFLWYGLAGYLIFLFVVVLIRAAITGITYDEAYTYLHFGQMDLLDLRKVAKLFTRRDCIANNHWLNSVLINLTVHAAGVEYNEFLIRLPSIMFLVMYLAGVVWGYRRKYYSLIALVFLVSNYYLLEFYGLARGYGMANTLVFFSCCFFCEWKRSGYLEHRYMNRLMILISLATFSNTIVLLLYPAFGAVCLFRLIQHKQFGSFFRKNWPVVSLFVIFTMLMVFYHMNISAEGKPLYTGGEQSFFQSVILGYAQMFVWNQKIGKILAAIIAISVIFCLILNIKGLWDNDYSLMLIVFAVTNLAMQLFMRKGYITGRGLLPFYAFLVFCLRELYIEAAKKVKYLWRDRRISGGIAIAICAAMLIQCIGKTDISRTQDWEDNYQIRDYAEAVYMAGGGYKPESQGYWAGEFYRQKYEKVIGDHLDAIKEKQSMDE